MERKVRLRKQGEHADFVFGQEIDIYSAYPLTRNHEVVSAISKTAEGQIFQYRLMQLASALFPENFPKTAALRFSESRSRLYANTYSAYVPDENGAIGRKQQALKTFGKEVLPLYTKDREVFYKKMDELQQKNNAFEHSVCPALQGEISKVQAAGILLAHPEANYHVAGANVVFFDVGGLVLKNLASHLGKMPDGSQKILAEARFAQLFCSMVEYAVHREKETGRYFEDCALPLSNYDIYDTLLNKNRQFFFRVVFGLVRWKNGEEENPFVSDIFTALKESKYSVQKLMQGLLFYAYLKETSQASSSEYSF